MRLSAMTLEEVRGLVGRTVMYVPSQWFGGQIESGVITSVNDHFVFVRYGASQTSKATLPRDLELQETAATGAEHDPYGHLMDPEADAARQFADPPDKKTAATGADAGGGLAGDGQAGDVAGGSRERATTVAPDGPAQGGERPEKRGDSGGGRGACADCWFYGYPSGASECPHRGATP